MNRCLYRLYTYLTIPYSYKESIFQNPDKQQSDTQQDDFGDYFLATHIVFLKNSYFLV